MAVAEHAPRSVRQMKKATGPRRQAGPPALRTWAYPVCTWRTAGGSWWPARAWRGCGRWRNYGRAATPADHPDRRRAPAAVRPAAAVQEGADRTRPRPVAAGRFRCARRGLPPGGGRRRAGRRGRPGHQPAASTHSITWCWRPGRCRWRSPGTGGSGSCAATTTRSRCAACSGPDCGWPSWGPAGSARSWRPRRPRTAARSRWSRPGPRRSPRPCAPVGRRPRRWYAGRGSTCGSAPAVESVQPGGLALAGGEWVAADEIVTAVGVRPASGLAGRLGRPAGERRGRRRRPARLAARRVRGGGLRRVRVAAVRAAAAVRALGRGAARARGGRGQHLGGDEVYDPVPYFWSEQFGRMMQYAGYHGGAESLVWRGDPAEPTWAAAGCGRPPGRDPHREPPP